jgi:hypothetical protein
VIFNLDHEMETLHFISNREDPYHNVEPIVMAMGLELDISHNNILIDIDIVKKKKKKILILLFLFFSEDIEY